jgi:17beta-estradiol 17-dehydrogenase / very-long-chain 3-oxoacyl-CoA reductase
LLRPKIDKTLESTMLSSFQMPSISPLAALGLGTLFVMSYKAFNFVHLYFLTPGKLSKYLSKTPNDEKSWALVTGSSDGIGFDLARLLYARGFNVLMHGRNPEKLAAKAELLRSERPDIKDQEIQFVIASATEAIESTDIITNHVKSKLKGGRLRVLINNVGGGIAGDKALEYLELVSTKSVLDTITLNAGFIAMLTRKLLPLMRRPVGASAADKPDNVPALILNVGSLAGTMGMPLIAPYSAGKAFGLTFSNALAQEMIMLKAPVEVIGLLVGEVVTNGNKMSKPSFTCLSSAEMAKVILDRVGCGLPIVIPSWKQGLLFGIADSLPTTARDTFIRGEMKTLRASEEKFS